MAKSVRALVASIMDPGDGELPGVDPLPPLDLDQIARELQLDERAEQAGRAGEPLPQADGPDIAELDILDYIERLARKAHEVYLSQIDQYETRIRKAVITEDLKIQIEAAGSNALANIKAQLIHQQNQLNLLLQGVRTREEEFRQFRERHGLTRPPKYSSPDERTLALLILIVLILIESIFNWMFFSEGTEADFIGGVIPALVLSILNIGVASLYARYGFPYLFHRRWEAQAAGVLAALLFLLWLIGLNLAIGHFRDLFVASSGNVLATDLWHRLTGTPLLLFDARSIVLVLLGVGLGLLAVIDVAATRDRYPGYAAVARDRQRAIDRYIEENSRCLTAMMELRDQTVNDMASAILLIRESQLGMLRAAEGRFRAHQAYVAYLNQLTGVHQRLVWRYRELNSRMREGDPPVYFQEPAVRPLFAEPPTPASLPGLDEGIGGEVIARIEYYIKAVNQEARAVVLESGVGG
jgi:hypothetical protein